MNDIVERLRVPTDADRIYEHVIGLRKQTKSDLPRQSLSNTFELLDEERSEAADHIAALEARNARLEEALKTIKFEADRENGRWVHLKRCIAAQCHAALTTEQTNG